MDVDQTYTGLVDGSATEVPAQFLGAIADRARKSTISPDVDTRLAAIRVALALPPSLGVNVAMALVRDADVRVRRRAVNVALKAQAEGLSVLRRLTADPDEGIAMAVLDVLVAAVDAASAGMARDLLRDPRASVRARAAALAGAAGGPGLLVDLRKVNWDPDPGVRSAVELAIERLTGKAERPIPSRWWERDAIPDEGIPLAPPPPFQPPADPEAAAAAAPPAPVVPTVPTAPPPAPAAPVGPAPDGITHFAALPTPLPTEVGALLSLTGLVATADREPLLAALKAAPPAELQAVVQRWRPGGDVGTGRGIALTTAALDRQVWMNRLQPMLADAQAGVRIAAVEAVGKMGGLSTIPWVTALLKDSDPAVVAAAAGAVGALCGRFQRAPMARQWLASLANDPRPGVADAARAALAAAGA